MARHRRPGPRLFVSRRRYLVLRREYEELLADYRALADNHDALLEAPRPRRPVPSWAVTEEIPVITTAGLDPDKAEALVRRGGLLEGPAGSWS